jgi:hypothetical protein
VTGMAGTMLQGISLGVRLGEVYCIRRMSETAFRITPPGWVCNNPASPAQRAFPSRIVWTMRSPMCRH